MSEYHVPNTLKDAKMGQKGYDKESVNIYVEELNSKIRQLETELEEATENGDKQESQLITQYKKDLEAAQKRATDAEKLAQDNAAQLQGANDKAAQLAAALKTEKEERSSDAQKMKQLLQQAQAQASTADEGKMKEFQEEIVALKGEISQLTTENTELKNKASADGELSESVKSLQDQLDAKEDELAKMQNELNDLGGQIFAKDSQIDDLKAKVEELESQSAAPSFVAPEMDMSAIFAEAQKNANQLVIQAKTAADKMTRDAETHSKKTIAEADAKAELTIRDAEEKAKKTTSDADATAKKTVDDANAEAARILKDAEDHSAKAKEEAEELLKNTRIEAEAESVRIKKDAVEQENRVRQLTATIRSMLTIEIEGMEKSVKEASELMAKAQSQMTEKIDSVNHIITEARSSVEESTKAQEQRTKEILNVPKEQKEEKKEEKKPEPSKPEQKNDFRNFNNNNNNNQNHNNAPKSNKPSPSIKEDFAESMLNDFAQAPNLENQFQKPVQKEEATPMPKPQKKLNFDMSELIKDAEASMSE